MFFVSFTDKQSPFQFFQLHLDTSIAVLKITVFYRTSSGILLVFNIFLIFCQHALLKIFHVPTNKWV